jgi:hypothetical protein
VKNSTYGRWWLHERRLEAGDNGTVHDDDCCDHRHFVSELNLRWTFWSLAGRLETIDRMEPVDPLSHWWRVWTDKTGDTWSWRLAADDRVHAIPPNPAAIAHLRFIGLPGGQTGPAMYIVPAEDYSIPDFNHTLAEAHYLGSGLGWRVLDRPDGGDEVVTEYPSKAKARAALLKAGQTHARILGLNLIKEEDLAGYV